MSEVNFFLELQCNHQFTRSPSSINNFQKMEDHCCYQKNTFILEQLKRKTTTSTIAGEVEKLVGYLKGELDLKFENHPGGLTAILEDLKIPDTPQESPVDEGVDAHEVRRIIKQLSSVRTNEGGAAISPTPGSVYVFDLEMKAPVPCDDGLEWKRVKSGHYAISGSIKGWRIYNRPVLTSSSIRKHITYRQGKALVYYYMTCGKCQSFFSRENVWRKHVTLCE
jgi:hypothetical protein